MTATYLCGPLKLDVFPRKSSTFSQHSLLRLSHLGGLMQHYPATLDMLIVTSHEETRQILLFVGDIFFPFFWLAKVSSALAKRSSYVE